MAEPNYEEVPPRGCQVGERPDLPTGSAERSGGTPKGAVGKFLADLSLCVRLWRGRRGNPLWQQGWRRFGWDGWAFYVTVVLGVFLSIGYVLSFRNGFLQGTFTGTSILTLLLPTFFLMGVFDWRRPPRVEQLLVTRLSREEVLFGSLFWPALRPALFSVCFSVSFLLVPLMNPAAMPFLPGILITVGLCLLIHPVILLKIIRFWLRYPNAPWAMMLLIPVSLALDLALLSPLILISYVLLIHFGEVQLGVVTVAIGSILLFEYNRRHAFHRATDLFFAQSGCAQDNPDTPPAGFL